MPAYFANISPVLVGRRFSALAVPIDGGRTLWGKRILGDHKTWRGLLAGVVVGTLVFEVQRLAYAIGFARDQALIDYSAHPLLPGLLMGLGAGVGERGLLLLAMVLTIPFLLPVSIPGTSTPFGLVIALIGVGIITNRPPWLPDRLMNRRLTADNVVPVLERGARLCARVEKLIHPRLFLLTHPATLGRINGVLLVLSALLLMVPLPLPFSNTLPAYGVVFLAAGSLERDGYVVMAGYLMVGLSIAYLSAVAMLGTARVQTLWAN